VVSGVFSGRGTVVMMRAAVSTFRMANMVNAGGLTDLRRDRRASEHKRDCECQEPHGNFGQYIGFGGVASDLDPVAQRVFISDPPTAHFSRSASTSWSVSVSIAMMRRRQMSMAMTAMHEQMDERTRSEEQVRKDSEHMRPMIFPEEEPANRDDHANRNRDSRTAGIGQ
jgi:hypothetical protein